MKIETIPITHKAGDTTIFYSFHIVVFLKAIDFLSSAMEIIQFF